MTALDYLLAHEWSMGNGQCPECHGVHAGWYPHPCHMTPDTIGHKLDCPLAASILDVGGKPLFLGAFKDSKQYENYITDDGFYSIREKTENGCPKIKEHNREFQESMDAAIMELLYPNDKAIQGEV
jgi:hypothetical protein